MELREILTLPVSFDSKMKIDQFLQNKNKSSHEYSMAFAQAIYMDYMLGDVSASFKKAYDYLKEANDRFKIPVYNSLIKMYYDQENYDSVYQTILQKRSFLPSYNKANYFEDLITYYQTIDDTPNLIQTLVIYLQDDISDERRLKALYLLLEIYLEEGMYDEYEARSSSLKTLSISQSEDLIYKEALYNDAYVLAMKGDYSDSFNTVEELLSYSLQTNLKAKALVLKLKDLMGLEEYNSATVFESENDVTIFQGDLETQLEFANLCISLYSQLSNNFNINTYVKKKETLLEQIEIEKISLDKRKKEKRKFVLPEEPLVLTEPVVEEVIEEPHEEVLPTEEEHSEGLFSLSEIFAQMNNNASISLRETIRVSLESLNKICLFDEAFIIYDYLGFTKLHYKKERLYDKRTDLTNTFILDVFENSKEEVIFDTSKTEYISEFTERYLSDESVRSYIGFSFLNGAIVFAAYDMNMINKKLNYEMLSLYKEMLAVKINEEINKLKNSNEYDDFTFLLNDVYSGTKRQIDNYIFLSDSASKLFNIPTKVNFQEFLAQIDFSYHKEYQKVIDEFIELKRREAHLEYKLVSGTNIIEDLKYNTASSSICSVFTQGDSIMSERKQNESFAYNDSLTKTYNKTKLIIDLDELKKDKYTAIMFEMIDYNYYGEIYGLDFAEDLLYAVAKVLKKYEHMKFDIYHFELDRFVLLSYEKFNQKNIVSRIEDILKYLADELHKINRRVNVKFRASFVRYPADTNQLDGKELVSSLLFSMPEEGVKEFSKEDYKEKMFETQLITYISEELDSKRLVLEYEPVFSHLNYDVKFYNVNINLSTYNVKNKDIYSVLKRRGMIVEVERYVLKEALKEISEIRKENPNSKKSFINISHDTFTNDFVELIAESLKEFNTPLDSFVVNYNGKVDLSVIRISNELIDMGISLSSANFEFVKKVSVKAIFLPFDMYSNAYIDALTYFANKYKIILIGSKVSSEIEANQLAEYGVSYFSGPLGGTHFTKDELINKN